MPKQRLTSRADTPTVCEVESDLESLLVPIDSIRLDPNNVRVHPEENQRHIRASLAGFRQQKPIVVDAEGIIRAGNGTWAQAKALGWTHIAAVRSSLQGVDAVAYAIADNRSSDSSHFDDEKLAQAIAELEDHPVMRDLFDELANGAGDTASDEEALAATPETSEEETIAAQYSVLVKCADEAEQKEVLAELDEHGFECRSLVVGFPETKAEPHEMPPLAKGEIEIRRCVEVQRTPRVVQMEGIFDVPPASTMEKTWRVRLDLDKPWQIGLIVGPSGCGKTTLAREIFGDRVVSGWEWPKDKSILDGFPEALGIAEITGLLSSVGFSSPPAWIKPFHVLSNGEQFRVNLARTLAESPDLAVVDEFTSVVDRTVAQIGSAAVAKAIRGSGRRFVAIACHYDVEEWLQPDWKFEPATGQMTWRSLRRRPPVELRVRRADPSAWTVYREHHYLSHGLNPSARCFVGEVGGQLAAFCSVLFNPHPSGGWWRAHRTVCLPDYQGVGIGNALVEFVASLYAATTKPFRSTTSHPAMIRHRLKSPKWICTRRPSLVPAHSSRRLRSLDKTAACARLTAGFQYIGPSEPEKASQFGILKNVETRK